MGVGVEMPLNFRGTATKTLITSLHYINVASQWGWQWILSTRGNNVDRGEAEVDIILQGLTISTVALTEMQYLFYYTEPNTWNMTMNEINNLIQQCQI